MILKFILAESGNINISFGKSIQKENSFNSNLILIDMLCKTPHIVLLMYRLITIQNMRVKEKIDPFNLNSNLILIDWLC